MTSDSGDEAGPAAGWRVKRKIDDVFGDDLPEVTSDECDQGHTGASKDWYEANRPPHYE
ncbi:hypothetical protein D7316_01811 [Gordonia insulae]|uniref:Uncharacterized protein n=1 Tax=Gordonia insulae TaxID=2420509 RepID=A0A3G8JJM3_9ACTN|nr:hypothetical protein D7316_01811 [Gordonia insulae]